MTTLRTQRPSYTLSLVDRGGLVQYQSAAIEALLGHRPNDLAGAAWFSLAHPEDAPPVRAQFADLVSGNEAKARWVLRFRAAEGGWRHVEVYARNLMVDPDVGGVLLSLRALGERHDEAAR